MEENICYLTCVIWDREGHYLLWLDGDDLPDFFMSNPDGTICIESSQNEIRKISQDLGLKIVDTAICTIDLDIIWPILRKTRQIRDISSEELNSILNGWNVMEDFARTLKLNLPPFSRERRKSIQKVYEKIFVGADVLGTQSSVDAERPALSSKERVIARDFLCTAWKRIRKHKKWP